MAIEIFTWCPRIEPTGEVTFRVKTAKFGDGYEQAAQDGINNKSQSWPLTFTGKEAFIKEIVAFLDKHGGATAFYWTAPLSDQALYRCKTYSASPLGAGAYNLTATFEQAFHP